MRLKLFILLILCIPALLTINAQKTPKKFVLSGLVVDASQKPLQGAMIFIDNKKTDYVTDVNGFYKLKVSSTAKTISVLTMNGLIAGDDINGRAVINFMIKGTGQGGNTGNNNEKVNIGYGEVDKGDLITNVGKIDGQNPKYASYKNIYDMIRGEVPGVQVVGTTITIQGPTSINLSSQPLFVVDGMVTTSIDDIRPQFVKSIEILKGSAASIYGSRGANGVILITLMGAENKK